MSKRETQLDKAIKDLDYQITVLAHAREALLAQRNRADLEAARPPKLKTVAK
jgi:cell division protein FtsB